MVGCLVQVDDNSQTRHEEEQEDDPALLQVFLEQPNQADEAEDERQEVIGRAARVLKAGRDVALVAESCVVDEVDAAEPVAVGQLALAFDVVLTAHKVPHEIAPIHPVALVVDEELHVLPEGGLAHVDDLASIVSDLYVVAGDDASVIFTVVFIHLRVRASLRAPHAGEEGLHLIRIVGQAALVVVGDDVLSLLFVLDIDGLAVFKTGDGRIIVCTVKQRPAAVLVAVDVSQHRKGFLGLVLVDGRVGVGTDDQHEERRVADEDEHQ